MKKKFAIYLLFITLISLSFFGCAKQGFSATEEAYGAKIIANDNKKNSILSNKDSYKVPMIMYHRVYTEKTGDYCITPDEFEKDLKYIRDNGYVTVTVRELISYKENEFAMPNKPITLTFDDCNYNNYSHVFPLLKKYKMKATFFIIGEFSERYSDGRKRCPATSHLSFEDLCEMNASGLCDIQNHTYDFHDWRRERFGVNKKRSGESLEDYKAALVSDLSLTQSLISDNVGIAPNAFAYPFGAYNADAEMIIAQMGFKAIVTTDGGINTICRNGAKDDIMRLKRYNRPHGEKNLEYILKNIKK